MWVQLKTVKNIEIAGKMRAYHAGDWVEVGRQTAMLWVSQGDAIIPGEQPSVISGALVANLPETNCGMLVPKGYTEIAAELAPKLDIVEGEPSLPFKRTIVWDGQANINPALIPVGLSLIESDRWEIAVPLHDYKMLAVQVGSEEERAATKAIIRDLRVPLYSTALMFARKTPDTERLFKLWNADEGENRMLAFLRSLYRVKPFILALPVNWTGANAPG